MFVVGESAGGNLALTVALAAVSAAEAMALQLQQVPAAVVLLSPWIDLTHSGDSHLTLAGLDPTLSVKHFLEPASLAYAGKQRLVSSPEVSPLWGKIPQGFPPTLLTSATRDLLLSDVVRLSAKLRAAGCNVDLRVAQGLWHVFEWYPHCPEAASSMQHVVAFLKQHCT